MFEGSSTRIRGLCPLWHPVVRNPEIHTCIALLKDSSVVESFLGSWRVVCVSLRRLLHVLVVYLKKKQQPFIYFSVRLLSVLHGHSVFSSPPQRPMTSVFEGFSIPDFIHYFYFPILILERESQYFPFECSVLNKGTTGTIVITSLV